MGRALSAGADAPYGLISDAWMRPATAPRGQALVLRKCIVVASPARVNMSSRKRLRQWSSCAHVGESFQGVGTSWLQSKGRRSVARVSALVVAPTCSPPMPPPAGRFAINRDRVGVKVWYRQLEPRRPVDAASREPEPSLIGPGFAQEFARVSQ